GVDVAEHPEPGDAGDLLPGRVLFAEVVDQRDQQVDQPDPSPQPSGPGRCPEPDGRVVSAIFEGVLLADFAVHVRRPPLLSRRPRRGGTCAPPRPTRLPSTRAGSRLRYPARVSP